MTTKSDNMMKMEEIPVQSDSLPECTEVEDICKAGLHKIELIEHKWRNINNCYPYRYKKRDILIFKCAIESIEREANPKYEGYINNKKDITQENIKRDQLVLWLRETNKPDSIPSHLQHKYISPGSFCLDDSVEYGSLYAQFCNYDREQEMKLRALFRELMDCYLPSRIYFRLTPCETDDLNHYAYIYALECQHFLNKSKLIIHKDLCLSGAFMKPKYFNDMTLKSDV